MENAGNTRNVVVRIQYYDLFTTQCDKLEALLKRKVPNVEVIKEEKRFPAFEISVNDEPVYSKVREVMLPDFDAVATMVNDVSKGGPITAIHKRQPLIYSLCPVS